jgi:Zn-dependent protease with chaperone function/uncharacterized tellurite resistance protein B-like protein
MDFFTLQDKAKKQTRFLIFLFIVAVAAIVFTTNLIFYFAISTQTSMPSSISQWLSQPYWLYVTGGTLILIIGTSLWRSWQLKSTPDAIAKMVNATQVLLSSKEKQERVLINVVEEMSIASGMPIPKLFIMKQEQGINAFVAGLDTSQVTLVVTQGLLDNLNRQELQGVIAHEYSHVFHGDMRINVRLIGILAGILVIGQLGGLLLRSGGYRHAFGRSSNNKSSNNAGGIIFIGVGLFAIGYIGLFFGRMIKAAISRQREFLADASAVQYTRDKEGIASALNKISMHQNHSLLSSAKAEEMSHMCFGESVKQSFSSLLATHPPISERIKAVNPGFSMRQKYQNNSTKQANNESRDHNQNSSYSNLDDAIVGSHFIQSSSENLPKTISDPIDSARIISSIGDVSPQQVLLAKALVNSIPKQLLSIAHGESDQTESYSLVIALLKISQNNTIASDKTNRYAMSHNAFQELTNQLAQLNFQQQHCLLDMSLARIEQLSSADNKAFVADLARMVAGDHQISQTEFMIYASAVKRALPAKNKKIIHRFKLVGNEVRLFFNLLFQQSHLEFNAKQSQFDRQMKLFGIETSKLKEFTLNISILSQALNNIAQLNPMLKKDFIQACIDVVKNDDEISQTEYELLRILGAYLDSPFPIYP